MIDIGWIIPILAVLNVFLYLWWRLTSYKKTFSEQYSPLNQRVLGVLVEDFYESVSKWAKDNKKRGKEVELSELMQSLGDLFAKSQKLSKWNDHISQGNSLLRTASSRMALTGVLLSCALVVFAVLAEIEFPLALMLCFFIAYGGLVYLLNGIRDWRALCRIESRIDKYHSDLTLGKSLITSNVEDDETEE